MQHGLESVTQKLMKTLAGTAVPAGVWLTDWEAESAALRCTAESLALGPVSKFLAAAAVGKRVAYVNPAAAAVS